jgi:hypothetical protein
MIILRLFGAERLTTGECSSIMPENNRPMKTVAAVLILTLLNASCWAETKTISPSTPANYVQALQTVNSFLWAWVNRDAASGRRLISHRLASKVAKEKKESLVR